MTYDVILTKSAEKSYRKLPAKLQDGIDRSLVWLENSPRQGPNIKRIEGHQRCYRYQVGGWRIIYQLDDESREVRVFDIRPRGDAYKH